MGLAGLCAAQGGLERAVRLLAAVGAHAERLNVLRPDYAREVAEVRATLGEAAFAAAWAKGEAMMLEQAMAAALDEPARPDLHDISLLDTRESFSLWLERRITAPLSCTPTGIDEPYRLER